MTLIGVVALKCLQKECSSLLDLGVLQEALDNLLNRSLWVTLWVSHSDHLGQTNGGLRIVWNGGLQDLDEVGSVVHLLAVGDNLIELIGFNESLDNLIGVTTFLESFQSQLWVLGSDGVTKFFTHGQLIVVDPAFDQGNLVGPVAIQHVIH